MTDEGEHEGPGGMDAIDPDPVTDSHEPGGMSGIPDTDPDSDADDESD